MRWRSILSVGSVFSILNETTLVLNLVGGLVCARALRPAEMGLWNSFLLLHTYGIAAQVGVINALTREYPYNIGAQRREHALALASTARAVAGRAGRTLAMVMVLTAVSLLVLGRWNAAITAVAFAISLGCLLTTTYCKSLFRTSGDLIRLGAIELAVAIAGLALAAVVNLGGYVAMCVRGATMGALACVLLLHLCPVQAAPCWNPGLFRHLVRVGLPILAVGYMGAVANVLDVTLLGLRFGASAVGKYTLAIVIKSTFSALLSTAAIMAYPRMAARYGRTGREHDLKGLFLLAGAAVFVLAVPTVLLARAALPWLVSRFLPQYAEGIPAAQTLCWGMIAGCFAGTCDVFTVIRKLRFTFIATAISASTFVGVFFWRSLIENPAMAAAQAFVSQQLVYSLAIVGLAAGPLGFLRRHRADKVQAP